MAFAAPLVRRPFWSAGRVAGSTVRVAFNSLSMKRNTESRDTRGVASTFVMVTSGDKGTPDQGMPRERLSSQREQEQVAAAARAGVTNVQFLRFPDGELTPSLELRGAITRMIRTFKPYAVFTHDPLALFINNEFINHPDHRAVGLATVDAIYPTARDPLQFNEQIREGLEPHKVKELYLWGSEYPNVLVDISDAIEDKIEALKSHVSQIGNPAELADRIKTRRGPGARRGVDLRR